MQNNKIKKYLSINSYINFTKKNFLKLLFLLNHFDQCIWLFYHLIKGISIFQISNPAIGHYPVDLFLASKIYGKKTIFVFKSGLTFANEYLNNKLTEKFNVNNNYDKVEDIKKTIESLPFNRVSFKKCPSILHMTEKLNYSNYFDGNSKLFEFNDKENKEGLAYLTKHNIEKEKYVCFLVRTAEYYISHGKRNREEIYKYRNVNPKSYIPTLEYLLNNNYKIIRMGKGVKSKFPFDHKNFIDYALSEHRLDFLDIWLTAHCNFFLSSSTGLGIIPLLFDTPLVISDDFPYLRMLSWIPKSMQIPRMVENKDGKLLNCKEQIMQGLHWNISQIYYDKIKVKPIENDQNDILKSICVMEDKIENGFDVSSLNLKFWHKTKMEWDEFTRMNKQNKKKFEHSDRFTFDHFHKINSINTVIPDFYLEKYKDVFMDY